ncbi:sulfotransferase family protein [Spongiactinospora rosea]|uniref:Sulfotransferase family protein n=1 Tax=Spongiactinospora rosea TaxID=2248750 RepID=A0A366LPE9_9ACTN|nr:sulfotransferase family protein [Spongiactinospora rosea]
MQVIGAGFPRTGTRSLKVALERLGFGPCFHMFEILSKPDHIERWLPAADGEPLDWDKVFVGYRSATDWPASHFWREQAAAYPDAKVVLTVRDPHRWYRSMQVLMAAGPGRELPDDLPPAATEMFSRMARFRPVTDRISREALGVPSINVALPDEDAAVAAFHRHVAEVKASLPAERLLVFDVREGWEPLCRFLDVEIPKGEPFPHLNESEWMRETLEKLINEGVFPADVSQR